MNFIPIAIKNRFNFSYTGVIFNHRSVFPVHFDGLSLERWWEKRIIFKVFARSPGIQTVCVGISKVGLCTSNVFVLSSSFGRDVKLGVPCLDAACTVGLN